MFINVAQSSFGLDPEDEQESSDVETELSPAVNDENYCRSRGDHGHISGNQNLPQHFLISNEKMCHDHVPYHEAKGRF